MTALQAAFSLKGHNPDVLTCIANLSNDEVFTPPEFANQMLDTLERAWAESNDGASIWADPNVTFLDPFTKSGVFLREITRRLTIGLEPVISGLEERVDHILTKQVFGIGITQLTSLLARRSVYCSKDAMGEHSIAKSFDRDWGNIWFERTEHTWVGGTKKHDLLDAEGNPVIVGRRCKYCGAPESGLGRDSALETHAYAFIHTDDIKARMAELFGADMQFDVIIGNPPYQLDDGGFGTSAAPIYQLFVEQAKALDPRYLSMVIPSRWFTGGKGLDEFRASMLGDGRIRVLHDYLSASDVFPGVGLKGGVNYFLWDRDHQGDCAITTHHAIVSPVAVARPLLEDGIGVFIRFNQGLNILKKVIAAESTGSITSALPSEKKFSRLVSPRKPFGLATTFHGTSEPAEGMIKVYENGGVGYTAPTTVHLGLDLIDHWKIFVGRAAPGTGNKDTYPHRVISTPFVGEPGSVSSETYLAIAPFDSKAEAENAKSYLLCRLPRLLIMLHKASQDVTRRVYSFVPTQDFSRPWTDEQLYEKYGIEDDEISFIESMVRPMEVADA